MRIHDNKIPQKGIPFRLSQLLQQMFADTGKFEALVLRCYTVSSM